MLQEKVGNTHRNSLTVRNSYDIMQINEFPITNIVKSDRFMQPMLGRMLKNGAMGEGYVNQNQLSHLPNSLKKLLDK